MVRFFELAEAFDPGVLRLGRRAGKWVPVEGLRHADLLGTEEVDAFFISPRFRAALYGLTGWRLEGAVVVEDHQGHALRYSQLFVTGRSGPVSVPRSSVIKQSDGFADVRGIVVDRHTWDGQDLFKPEGMAFVLLSEDAANGLRGACLSNVQVEQASRVLRQVPAEEVET